MRKPPSRLAAGTGGPKHRRVAREAERGRRSAAIRAAAEALAAEGQWPSVARVAERAGISVSSVDRDLATLAPARRRWVAANGEHPHWRDTEDEAAGRRTAKVDADRLQAQLDHALERLERERKARRRAERAAAAAQEELRRLYPQVRPADCANLV